MPTALSLRHVLLVDRHYLRLTREAIIMQAHLLPDLEVVPDRVSGRAIEDVDDSGDPLRVPEEVEPKSYSPMRTLNKAWYFHQGELKAPPLHKPKHGFQGGEWVGGDVRPSS